MNYKKIYKSIQPKYKPKYKRGGSPQPNISSAQNISPEPSIASNISNSYNNFKDILYDIKIYIKSNFVFVLMVSVLLIFYTYLMFTEPLTEEDLQERVETIKCGDPQRGWTRGCPNKTLAANIECVNNQCNEETCCVNEQSCSEWLGNCRGNDFAINGTNTCLPDIDNDCSEKCCVKTCRQFLNSSCPNNQIKVADNFCSKPDGSDNYVCSYNDCCSEQITCATFLESDCPSGQMLSNTASSITCDNNNCTPLICCDEISTNPDNTQEPVTNPDTTQRTDSTPVEASQGTVSTQGPAAATVASSVDEDSDTVQRPLDSDSHVDAVEGTGDSGG